MERYQELDCNSLADKSVIAQCNEVHFLPRDVLYSAKRGIAIACRPSVCL